MATARGLTLQDPLIPLVSELSSKYFQHIMLTHQVNIHGGNTKNRKTKMLTVDNGHDVEYFLCVVVEFQDVMQGNI